MRHRRRTAVVTLTTLLVAAFANVAEASPPQTDRRTQTLPGQSAKDFAYMSPETLNKMRQQEKLHPAVDAIYAAVDSGRGMEGFSSVAFEDDGVSVYWKGQPSAEINTALVAARKYGTVRVKEAAYSKAELAAAARKIEAAVERGSDVQLLAVHDGLGITIERMAPSTFTRQKDEGAGPPARISEVLPTLSLDVPVKIVDGSDPARLRGCANNQCWRLDDESPWNAGTFLGGRNGAWNCSSGFAVRDSSNFFLYRVMTAAHCASVGDDYFTDFAGETVGNVYIDDWDRDVAVLNAQGWQWMWDGDAYTSNYKTVKSWANRVSGEWLCQSGRNGVKCDIVTANYMTNLWVDHDSDYDGSYWMHNISVAARNGNQAASEDGDSGGPVFSLDGQGVRAKGLVSAGGGTYGEILYFTDMSNILGRNGGWGVKVG